MREDTAAMMPLGWTVQPVRLGARPAVVPVTGVDGMITQVCLSRKVNQSVIVGDRLVEIIVQEILPGRVKLVIRAPRELSVDREEIWERKQLNQETD